MISPRIKWLSQRDNLNAFTGDLEAHNQCMIASFVMMMQWLREWLILNDKPAFENYDELTHYIVVGESKDKVQKVRFMSVNHAKKLNIMLANYKNKIPHRFIQKDFTYQDVLNYVAEKKRPVLIGTMETGAGHILCFDGQIQNPYGNPNRQIHTGSCKYDSIKGDNLDYSKEFAEAMVFREMVEIDTGKKYPNGKKITIFKTSKTNVKRPCWIIEDI